MSQGYSYEWDEKYCYPNSFILKNKFNITDGAKLEIAEKEYTSLNIAEIKVNQIKGNLDLRHIQDIYEFVFKAHHQNVCLPLRSHYIPSYQLNQITVFTCKTNRIFS